MDYSIQPRGKRDPRNDRRIVVDGQVIVGGDYAHMNLLGFTSIGSQFESCSFEGTRIGHGYFGAGQAASRYVDCIFDGVRAHFGAGGYARFERCSFRDVLLEDWFCFAVELVDCTFTGRLRRAFFNGSVRETDVPVVGRVRNEFTGNDFAKMDFEDVDFRTGIDLASQTLPTGPEYLYVPDAPRALASARAHVLAWEDLDSRRLALVHLRSLDESVTAGQSQLLLRLDDYPRNSRPAVRALFDALAAASQ